MRKIHFGSLIFMIALPILTGMLSALISNEGMKAYATMTKPPLSPPAFVFSIAWTILYIMMGLAAYFIYTAEIESDTKQVLLALYTIQLIMNFMWSIVFFNFKLYLLAFIWLIILWIIVIAITVKSYPYVKTAAFLLLPYVLWLTFAAYLNLGSYILSVS